MAVNQQSVAKILEAVGGKDNIAAVTHCVTRLRFALQDESVINQKSLEINELVKGSFSSNGQFQVIIGPGIVEKVYAELLHQTGGERASKEDIKNVAAQKMNPLQRAIKTLADIFIPILPAIVTAGLLMGLHNILTGKGIFFADQSLIEVYNQWQGFAEIINLIANTSFVFLPGLIGWSAVKKIGGSQLLGIVLGLMLIHPDLLNAWSYGDAVANGTVPHWNLFGLQIEKIGYQGQVLPVLIAAFCLAKIEIFLNKRVPDSFKLLLVAPITLLLTGFLSFIVIGPLTFAIGNLITSAFVSIFEHAAVVGGLIYGSLYPLLVVTGMHHAFLAVDLQLIASTGSTFLWPILALSNIAQGSAALAVMFISRDEKLKGMSITSAVSAYLGITEPAMFGVNLRLRYPFIAAMIGSATGAVCITAFKVQAASIGVGGLPGFLSIFPKQWGPFFIGMILALVVPFIITYLIGKTRKQTITGNNRE
ncbi:PTS system trehalose-specific EIIBC component TreP [Paenibacillus larvae subsp. larvae]|uniref:PTS system trehalose-specific EIIBC component TreP n=1 Tax=Paenibacillus larvae subsp. larvae TaxID=147375 RepID=A0A2L1U0S3_9BACL|nr:PTS system trehalose-specific EIIBC component [Paenibacillus larvae]AQT83322.1 PTS trehalose transporter subunit IIBC [Paenibacillus larvae subsp. pulvifaciens]AQZ48457.1 PTS trehalose transporter subunit IIBC [Paenibacillus larvae subsp. pulvifaciens]AVF26468.1 PTS system trehalose-specific EIIBC component TreP [Paenibacillus larvae subsp. larvae]AVF31244.1 PTS system trehalose-specific EIIBC component TreP [Paenibacillus larvae subsp. larvae]MBH0341438.1 trehalose permease IIC protein [Pa